MDNNVFQRAINSVRGAINPSQDVRQQRQQQASEYLQRDPVARYLSRQIGQPIVEGVGDIARSVRDVRSGAMTGPQATAGVGLGALRTASGVWGSTPAGIAENVLTGTTATGIQGIRSPNIPIRETLTKNATEPISVAQSAGVTNPFVAMAVDLLVGNPVGAKKMLESGVGGFSKLVGEAPETMTSRSGTTDPSAFITRFDGGQSMSVPDDLIQEARKYKSAEEFVKNIDLETFIKHQVPEIKKVEGNTFITKDGNKIEFIVSNKGDTLSIKHIEAETKGTGIGSKLVKAVQDYADMNLRFTEVSKPYNNQFWKKMGYDTSDGNVGRIDDISAKRGNELKSQLTDIYNQAKQENAIQRAMSVPKTPKYLQEYLSPEGYFTEGRFKSSSYPKNFVAKSDVPDTNIKSGDRVAIVSRDGRYEAILDKPYSDGGFLIEREFNVDPSLFNSISNISLPAKRALKKKQ